MAKAEKRLRRKAKRRTGAKRGQRAKTKKQAKCATPRLKRKPHKFTISHHREEDFDAGLRPYSAYRDLGIAPATGGMVQAHVIRMTKPFDAGRRSPIPHYHDVEFQMVYVLKGWFASEFEGEGVHTFTPGRAGSSRRKSSTRCAAIPTIANCWRSCCRRISDVTLEG